MTNKSKCCNAEILTDAEDTSGNCLDVCSECRHECDVTDEGKENLNIEVNGKVIDLDSVKDNKSSPSVSISNTPESWEEEFDKLFVWRQEFVFSLDIQKDAKSFISQLLSTERERVVEEIRRIALEHYWDSLESNKEIILQHLDDLLKTLTPSSQDEEK